MARQATRATGRGFICQTRLGPCQVNKYLIQDAADNCSKFDLGTDLTISGPCDAVYYSETEIWIFDQYINVNIFNPVTNTFTVGPFLQGKPGISNFYTIPLWWFADGTGWTVDFDYIEIGPDRTPGFVGITHQTGGQIKFLNKDTLSWSNLAALRKQIILGLFVLLTHLFVAASGTIPNGAALTAIGKRLAILTTSSTAWYYFDGKDSTTSDVFYKSGSDIFNYAPLAEVSSVYFPDC